MSASRNGRKVFKQIGVLLPHEKQEEDPHERVIQSSQVSRGDNFMNDGFLFVRGIQMGPPGKLRVNGERVKRDQSVFVVQSESTGELFLQKLLEARWDSTAKRSYPPSELRASTYRYAVGDPRLDALANSNNDVRRRGVVPSLPCFNKLRFWQELDPRDPTDENVTVYSLFFEFCNGGNMEQFLREYEKRGIAIPEHFIWLVAEQLFSALVAMKFGPSPRQNDWARIYHRDLHPNNVFINYPPRRSGRAPRMGLESNAFPEIVVGDFGNSGIEGDHNDTLPVSVYPEPDGDRPDDVGFLAEWEDIFSVGELLRQMVMTHIPDSGAWDLKPNCGRVQDANQQRNAPPYSRELIDLLKLFEYPNQENMMVRDLRGAVDTTFPSPEDLRDTLLPQAQARVAALRRPADRPAGYFDGIDVSWTKPEQLMPFSYVMKYSTEARDGPDEEEDDESGDDHGDGSGDGSGDGDGSKLEMSELLERISGGGFDGHDQPDDGQQQPEEQEHPSGAEDDSQEHDSEDVDDEDDGGESSSASPPRPPPEPPEKVAMRELGKMHKWNGAKPRYELRSLEFGAPAILRLKRPP